MKKLILFLSIILIAFSSCKKDEPKAFKLDPNATINLRPDLSAWNAPKKVASPYGNTASQHLTPLEIVKQTTSLKFHNDEVAVGQLLIRGFADAQRDTLSNPPLLKMWGTDIIDSDGGYVTEFINGTDFYLIKQGGDTIGYIPNSVIINAREKIKSAYDNKNYEEVYKLFNEVFTFRPITGSEYKKLKAEGKN